MRFYRHIQTYVESLNLSGNFGVNGSTVLHQVNNTARVSPFVIVPGNTLDEAWVKHNSGTGIEDGGDGVTLVVSRYKRLVRVSKESLHVTPRSLLDLSADFFVSGFLCKFACKINNRNINGGNTEGHSGKLSLQGGDNLGYGMAAPVEEGMMFPEAARPPRQSLRELESTTAWVAVMARTVVIKASSIPKASLMALTIGASPLVVQEAQEMKSSDPSYSSWLTPITMVWESSLAGAE